MDNLLKVNSRLDFVDKILIFFLKKLALLFKIKLIKNLNQKMGHTIANVTQLPQKNIYRLLKLFNTTQREKHFVQSWSLINALNFYNFDRFAICFIARINKINS